MLFRSVAGTVTTADPGAVGGDSVPADGGTGDSVGGAAVPPAESCTGDTELVYVSATGCTLELLGADMDRSFSEVPAPEKSPDCCIISSEATGIISLLSKISGK